MVGDRWMLTTARIREDLLKATEETLEAIAAAAAHRKPGPANFD